jgi:hypothetical protein
MNYTVKFDLSQWAVCGTDGKLYGRFDTEPEARLHVLMLRGIAQSQQGNYTVKKEFSQWAVYDKAGRLFGRFDSEAEANQFISQLFGVSAPPAPPPPPPSPAPPLPPPSPWPPSMGGQPGVSSPAGMGGWPMGMAPPPQAPSGWPAGMGGAPPPPVAPVGMGGFPLGMGGRPIVPPPRRGLPIGPRRARRPPPPPTRAQQFARTFQRVFPATSAFGGRGSVGRAASAAFATAFPEAKLVKDLAQEAMMAARALYDFTERTLEANKSLAAFSPMMATAFARLQMGDFRRQLGMGRDTEMTGAALVRSMDRLRDSFYPFEVLNRNIRNEAAGFTAGAISGAGNQFAPVLDALEAIRRQLDPSGDAGPKIGDAIAGALVRSVPIFGLPLGMVLDLLAKVNKFFGVVPVVPGQGIGNWDELFRNPPGPLLRGRGNQIVGQ